MMWVTWAKWAQIAQMTHMPNWMWSGLGSAKTELRALSYHKFPGKTGSRGHVGKVEPRCPGEPNAELEMVWDVRNRTARD